MYLWIKLVFSYCKGKNIPKLIILFIFKVFVALFNYLIFISINNYEFDKNKDIFLINYQ